MTRWLGFSVSITLASLPLFAVGCGSSSGGDPFSTSAGAAGSGISNSGSGGSSGSASSGGSQNRGGNQSAGGAAGASPGCRDRDDCPAPSGPPVGGLTQCLSPGQTPPPYGCGAPMWCGQCMCPPQPTPPLGSGEPCQTSQDCPPPSDTEATASLCVSGQCTRCSDSLDCPMTAPVCTFLQAQFGLGFQSCTECAVDADCGGERPYCRNQYGNGKCVACRSHTDCAEGLCADGVCTPECGPEAPCANPLTECHAELRCGPLSCSDDSTCPPNHRCNSGGCARRACDEDADCDGFCVNSFCYESLGACHTQYAVP